MKIPSFFFFLSNDYIKFDWNTLKRKKKLDDNNKFYSKLKFLANMIDDLKIKKKEIK